MAEMNKPTVDQKNEVDSMMEQLSESYFKQEEIVEIHQTLK